MKFGGGGSIYDSTSPDLVSERSRPGATGATSRNRTELREFKGVSNVTDYEVEKKVGEGTFGLVNICRHKTKSGVFALKKILMHNEKEGVPITALREIRLLKSLNHKNIITLTEMAIKKADGKHRGEIHMVFPYMEHDMSGLLENPNVCFTPAQIKSFMKQLLEGTHYLHLNSILHRDMKTANILVDARGTLKIADFGLARALLKSKKDVKYTNCVVTRWYRPPELLMGETIYGPAIDMWGVGCVFGEILKRRPILMGNSDLDQLEKIFELCGTPTQQSWPNWDKLPDMKAIAGFERQHHRSIKQKFHQLGGNQRHMGAVELLEKLLVCDPAQRMTAQNALTSVYFFHFPHPAEPGTSE
ncbi:kinase-like domain-containing protein [Zopfochytrium polystomum]|nr:kinase-like domain-containing protein [Zopfochytrium polystomum]